MENRFTVDIRGLQIAEDDTVLSSALGGAIDESEQISPYRRRLSSSRWFHDWNQESENEYNEMVLVFSSEIDQASTESVLSYRIQIRMDSAFSADEIDSVFFFYTLGIHFSNTMKKHRRSGAPAFYGSRIESGSTLIEFFAGVATIGAAVSAYPKLRQGVLEIIGDARFLASALSNALAKSTELPLSKRKEPHVTLPYELHKQYPSEPQIDAELRRRLRANRGDWHV